VKKQYREASQVLAPEPWLDALSAKRELTIEHRGFAFPANIAQIQAVVRLESPPSEIGSSGTDAGRNGLLDVMRHTAQA
jgi:hypothetical protein